MATVHREPNRVKWIGVRPGHNGEQVLEHGEAIGATVVLYTVPATKILLLFGFTCGMSCSANGVGTLGIYTDVPVLHRYLFFSSVQANNAVAGCRDYSIPIEIPAGYSIRAISAAATLGVRAVIDGILIDA